MTSSSTHHQRGLPLGRSSGPVVQTSPTDGMNRSRNPTAEQWRAKHGDAGKKRG